MKKSLVFLLLVFISAACDRVDNTLTLHDDNNVNELTKSSVSDELFSFDKIKEQWSSYNSLSEMFAATMMPDGGQYQLLSQDNLSTQYLVAYTMAANYLIIVHY